MQPTSISEGMSRPLSSIVLNRRRLLSCKCTLTVCIESHMALNARRRASLQAGALL